MSRLYMLPYTLLTPIAKGIYIAAAPVVVIS